VRFEVTVGLLHPELEHFANPIALLMQSARLNAGHKS
jgi:hypothetical protein